MVFYPQRNPLIGLPNATIVEWEKSSGGATMAIDLNRVKTFLNVPIEDVYFDPEKESFIAIATEAIESYCQMSLTTTTWVGHLPEFYDQIRLLRRPFQSVTKLEYVDQTSGVVTTVDPTTYVVGTAPQKCGMIYKGDGLQWPAAANRWDGVRVTVTSGWASGQMPKQVEHALLLTISALDHARADDMGASGPRTVYALRHQVAPSIIPMEAKALLAPWRYISAVAG